MATTPETPRQPLFYLEPQPLNLPQHREMRVQNGDYAFASEALAMPAVIGEFADLSRTYPILFAAGDNGGPIALLGVDATNTFVSNGAWEEGVYIPAYIRRHPFALMALTDTAKPEEYVLAIDVGCGRITTGGSDGAALFDGEEPSAFVKEMLNFCSAYSADGLVTAEFCKALRAKGLLNDQRLDGTLPDGQKIGLDGFQVIDTKKLTELDAETVVEWHRRGWLAACFFHLASLQRVGEILNRRAKIATPIKPAV